MSTAAVTITSAVRLNAATITQYLASQPGLKPDKRRVVLLRAAPSWDGPDELPWGEQRRATVAAAPSPLGVYELLLAHQKPSATGPDVLVILTDREEAELGPDLLAKVHRQRVNAVDTWDVVREAFGRRRLRPPAVRGELGCRGTAGRRSPARRMAEAGRRCPVAARGADLARPAQAGNRPLRSGRQDLPLRGGSR